MAEGRSRLFKQKFEYIGLTKTFDKQAKEEEHDKVPKQVLIQSPPSVVEYSLKIHSKKGDEHFDDLIEDIIIEYREHAGEEESYYDRLHSRLYYYSYLRSYVSIGIPSKIYDMILKDASVNCHIADDVNDIVNHGYTWVVAAMGQGVLCHVPIMGFGNENPAGLLYDEMTLLLKSNLRGNGRFDVQVIKDQFDRNHLKLTLTGFQLVEQTKISSIKRQFSDASISDDLQRKLMQLPDEQTHPKPYFD